MFSLKKIMWTNENLAKEQFVEVRGTRLRVSLRSLATPRQAPLAHTLANINLLHCELASRMFNFKIQYSKYNFSSAYGRVKSGLCPR